MWVPFPTGKQCVFLSLRMDSYPADSSWKYLKQILMIWQYHLIFKSKLFKFYFENKNEK